MHNIPTNQKKLLTYQSKKLAATRINTGTTKMKMFEYVFELFGILAVIGIALGAYWHIYTLGACALIVWLMKTERKNNK